MKFEFKSPEHDDWHFLAAFVRSNFIPIRLWSPLISNWPIQPIRAQLWSILPPLKKNLKIIKFRLDPGPFSVRNQGNPWISIISTTPRFRYESDTNQIRIRYESDTNRIWFLTHFARTVKCGFVSNGIWFQHTDFQQIRYYQILILDVELILRLQNLQNISYLIRIWFVSDFISPKNQIRIRYESDTNQIRIRYEIVSDFSTQPK
jgi:hypothetical protein